MLYFNVGMLSIHSNPLGKLGTRDTGGMSVFLLETAHLLGKMGHSVDLFTLGDSSTQTSVRPIGENVRLIHLAIDCDENPTKENLYHSLPKVLKAYEKYVAGEEKTYSLIHSHYWLSGVLGQMIQQKYNLPHCITFHTLGAVKNMSCLEENEPESRIINEERLVAHCHRIIAFTQKEKNNLISLYGGEKEKINIVSCGVNSELFLPIDASDVKTRLGLSDDMYVLLFVGRYVPIKGIDQLLKAVSLLDAKYEINLILIGGENGQDKSTKELLQKIENLSIGNRISIAGRVEQPDLPMYYSAADVLVIPSFHESFSLVALEALSCGTPVIGTSVGGIPEVIGKGNGLVLENNQAEVLADAIEKLIIKKSLPLLGQDQIRMSVKKYSWQRTVSELTTIYTNMIDVAKGKKT